MVEDENMIVHSFSNMRLVREKLFKGEYQRWCHEDAIHGSKIEFDHGGLNIFRDLFPYKWTCFED